MANEKYKFEEETDSPKLVVTISGLKGTGKTTFMFSPTTFEGKHYCLSFDHKSLRIKKNLYNDAEHIVVIDGEKYYVRSTEEMVPSSTKNYEYLIAMLDHIQGFGDADWIEYDCLERLHEICEMVMRDGHNLKPFAGFSEKIWWKERRILIGNLHRKALAIAKKGVIYTTFLDYKDNLLIDDEFENVLATPRYFDMIRDETDVIFRTHTKYDKGTKELRFYARVESSKVPKFRTGKLVDVTGIYEKKGG